MTTDKAIKFFNKLRSQTTKKSELKIYDDFIQTLTRLSKRDFSIEDIISIETKLDALNLRLPPYNKKKHYTKALYNLKDYLNREFSLVSKGYYTAIGTSLGICLGVAFGTAIEKSNGITFGTVVGLLIGLVMVELWILKQKKKAIFCRKHFKTHIGEYTIFIII